MLRLPARRLRVWLGGAGLTLVAAVLVAPAIATVPLPPKPWLTPVPSPTSPADRPEASICQQPEVQCPDLAMRAPYQFVPDVEEGKHVLRAANAVLSIGEGPVEIRGRRTGARVMEATQYIHRGPGRSSLKVPGGAGHVIFKMIPGQGRYWKFQNAARFELWTTGEAPTRVRIGEKLTYCLRDLRKLWYWKRSPKHELYPACSQDPKAQHVRLGTSPGWSDIYPAPYYDQWIDIGGLAAGCYTLYHVADPLNEIVESNEDNNAAASRVRLPIKGRHVHRC